MKFMKRITGAVALGAALLVGGGPSVPSAQAGYVATLTEQASNVEASGSGALDVTGLTLRGSGFSTATFISPSSNLVVIGEAPAPGSGGLSDSYFLPTNTITPPSFGSGSFASGSGTGGKVGILSSDVLVVPFRYITDTPFTSTATFPGVTFNTLGVTPGTYEWTWGGGLNQNFALEIGATPLPPFAGTPGQPNCSGQSVSALAQQFGGISNAAATLGFSSVSDLQSAIETFCATGFIASSAAQQFSGRLAGLPSAAPEPPHSSS